MSADQSEDSVHRRTLQNCATQRGLVFGQAVFLSPLRPPPLARFVDPKPGPDLAARIQDGDLITNSGFSTIQPPACRLTLLLYRVWRKALFIKNSSLTSLTFLAFLFSSLCPFQYFILDLSISFM